MKIKNIEHDRLTFEDGSTITYSHEQDCCERVYADFKYLIDETGILEAEFDLSDEKLIRHLSTGFSMESINGIGYFVPCYDIQNGYYSPNLNIIITLHNGETITFNVTDSTMHKYSHRDMFEELVEYFCNIYNETKSSGKYITDVISALYNHTEISESYKETPTYDRLKYLYLCNCLVGKPIKIKERYESEYPSMVVEEGEIKTVIDVDGRYNYMVATIYVDSHRMDIPLKIIEPLE